MSVFCLKQSPQNDSTVGAREPRPSIYRLLEIPVSWDQPLNPKRLTRKRLEPQPGSQVKLMKFNYVPYNAARKNIRNNVNTINNASRNHR